jgi:hypothetical protein
MEVFMIMRYIKLVAVLSIVLSVQYASAWIYSFSNHTNEPLKVRIQLHADTEWYERIILPKSAGSIATQEFRFTVFGDPQGTLNGWKLGFCLQEIQFATPVTKMVKTIAPNGEDLGLVEKIVKDARGNIQFGPWANVVTEYVQNEGANAMLRASESFADGLQEIATSVARTVSSASAQ